ncbi:Spermatogenesis-associated protein 4 (Testis and spermatogenesis cell-related protein 2) (Testis spermatocyte apoptosis-related gene 2 protein) [Durusdinium trenchii]|uniref:Spermatogenesis-associated protein 4 (Testis and spermatogenesis cell-related protein 2) (Testis spermatocyte apoptosis-related gene 2 protein) n=1 Tax=Durusdinium trenchii TaxID=1381693 RepID=A0ABP0P8C5_9DINO
MSHANALPREVLRWLQGLDLSYSVRHVKRDFSNGFLFAEVFSRYYESDVNVHGFSNGTGSSAKNDNWFQLRRLCDKWGVDCSPERVNNIIHCKDGAAVEFIEELFTLLTERKIQKPQGKRRDFKVPAFARDTASNLIKKKLKEPDMINVQDSKAREYSIIKALDGHNSKIQLERRSSREESEMSGSLASSSMQSHPETETNATTMAPIRPNAQDTAAAAGMLGVQVTKVKVKQLDKNLTTSRARKEVGGGAAVVELSSFSAREAASEELGDAFSVLEMIDRTIAEELPATPAKLESESGAPPLNANIGQLLDVIQQHEDENLGHAGTAHLFAPAAPFQDSKTASVFRNVAEALESQERVVYSEEFYSVSNLLATCISHLPDQLESFDACKQAFVAFARLLRRQVEVHHLLSSSRKLLDMALTFVLPRFVPLLKDSPRKRHACLFILSEFAGDIVKARILLIKRLHETVDDIIAFLHCLTILVFLEQSMSSTGDGMQLTDLYEYYASIGLAHASPNVRAAGLAMVAALVQHDVALVGRMLPPMRALVCDPWWEVQAQLVVVAAKIADQLEENQRHRNLFASVPEEPEDDEEKSGTSSKSRVDHEDDAHWDAVLEIICSTFHTEASVKVQKVGLAFLGRHTGRLEPLAEQYVAVMLKLSEQAFRNSLPDASEDGEDYSLLRLFGLIDEREQLAIASACGGVYELDPITASWDLEALGRQLASNVERQGLQNLEFWHLEILHALIQAAGRSAACSEGKAEEKVEREAKAEDNVTSVLFSRFREHVFLAICDADNFGIALHTIRAWVVDHGMVTVLQDLSFLGALKLLFSQSVHKPSSWNGQRATADLFSELFQLEDAELAGEARALISTLCSSFPELLQNDTLAELERLSL